MVRDIDERSVRAVWALGSVPSTLFWTKNLVLRPDGQLSSGQDRGMGSDETAGSTVRTCRLDVMVKEWELSKF